MSTRNRVGLFGGTFNPIHMGHLRVAEEALRQCGLKKVVFLPTGQPPHREVAEGVPGEWRYEMVRLAIQSRPGFEVSRLELSCRGPCYTIDTVRTMSRRHPEGVAYILGADAFAGIQTWKDWQELLRSCPFIVAPRKGFPRELFAREPFTRADVFFLDMEEIDLSSCEIRRAYREGLPTQGLVPPQVDQFIRAHGLYGVAQTEGVG
ncbi:MAG TPA: nicotinate (nicotinamide) nucleotide adenylyltransferase [Candidatus Acetothermia bacterium]|nr:nicotinate (nicotinamide) nucleotide adenylyltransferase [Candidatus Acetothermia bacterium]